MKKFNYLILKLKLREVTIKSVIKILSHSVLRAEIWNQNLPNRNKS